MTPAELLDSIQELVFSNNKLARDLRNAEEERGKLQRELRDLAASVRMDEAYALSLKGMRGTHILRRQDGFEKILTLQLGFPPVLKHLPPQPPSSVPVDSSPDELVRPLEFRFSRFLHTEGTKLALYLEI